MAIKDCIDEIRKIAGGKLTDEDIQAVAKDVERRARIKRAKDVTLSRPDALAAAAEDIGNEAATEKAVQQLNRAQDLIREKARQDYYKQAVSDGYTPRQAIDGKTVGIERDLKGGGSSTDARGKAVEGGFLGGLTGDLRKAGVLKLFTARLGAFAEGAGIADRELNRALWSIGEDGKVDAPVSRETAKVAEVIHKWLEAARLRLNREGAFIRKLPGYITRQSWDMAKIRAMTKADFIKFLMPLLDHDTTFGSKDPLAFMSSAYDAMSTGVHIKTDMQSTGFKGPGNLAKKVSQERVLHFKSADAWTTANEKIGLRSTAEAVIAQLRNDARNVALMETWGTNPEQNFKDDIRWLQEQHRDKPKWVDELNDKRLQDYFGILDGSANIVDNTRLANWSSNIRGVQSMAKLPLAALSHLNILATAASELKHQGVPLGERYMSLLSNFAENAGGADKLGLISDLGVAYESMAGAISSRFSAADSQPGMMSRTMRSYFKLNGMRFVIETARSALGQTIGHELAREAGKSFAELNAARRILLEHYGFNAKRWDVVRQGTQILEDGRAYLAPDGIERLPDDAFAPLGAGSKRAAQRMRDELGTSLRTYINDRVDHGVPTPGARERAIMTRGTRPGTVDGELLRFVWQFKQYPLTLYTKYMQREFGKFQDGRGDILGVAHMIAATTVMGMLAMQAKQLAKGRTTREMIGGNWPAVWTAALQQGGGAGIYGDFLFGQYSDFGGTPLETASGPTLGTASQAIKDFTGLYHTKETADGLEPLTTKADMLRLAMDNMPNLAYTRIALNYLILYQLQEAASPGYLRRMETNMRNQNNQTMILPPSSVISHGGRHNTLLPGD